MNERRKQWSSTSRSFSRKGSNLLKKWKNIIQKTSSKCLQMSRRCLMKMMMIMIPRVQFCEEAIWRHFYPSITGTSVCKCQRLTCERQTNFSNSLIGLSSFGKFIRPVTIIYWRYSSRQNVIFHCRKLTRKAHIQSRSLQAGIHLRRSFQCARSWRIPSSSSCLALSRGSPARRIGS